MKMRLSPKTSERGVGHPLNIEAELGAVCSCTAVPETFWKDIRANRVETLRKAVARGEYRVSSEALAESLIKRMLLPR